jgi:hypothetical protein
LAPSAVKRDTAPLPVNKALIHLTSKMEDVLAVYEKPYTEAEPVVCLDEKPVSLHAEIRPSQPARPGHLAKRDS